MNNNIPAIPALEAYLAAHDLSAHKFAISNGLDPSMLSKVLRGLQKSVEIETAIKIEQATDGVVAVGMWVPR